MKRLIFIILILFLTACNPAPGPLAGAAGMNVQSTEPPTQTGIIESPYPTNTPIPSPTPLPVNQINDPDTWPQAMQDYFYGDPDLWSDSQKTAEFNAFIIQARMELLSRDGWLDVKFMDQEQLFQEYLKWGTEHPTVLLVFSIQELRDMVVESLHRDTAIFSYQDGSVMQNGIYVDFFNTGPMIMDQYLRFASNIESRETAFANTVNFDVLGVQSTDLLPSYYGAYGDLIARFQLPVRIDPATSEGILVHFYLNNEHRYLPLVINYQSVAIPSWSVVITSYENVINLSGAEVVLPVRSSFMPEDEGTTNLVPSDIQNLIGQRVHIRYDHALASGYLPCMFFPYNLGIPNTSVILSLSEDIQFTEPIIVPWDAQY